MKIASITPYDLSTPGGVNRYALDIARWVRTQGHDVDLIGPASSRDGTTPSDVTVLGHPKPVAAGGTVAAIALDFGLRPEIGAVLDRERYDVVHLHEPLMPVLPLQFLREATSMRIPTIGTFHAAETTGRRVYRVAGHVLARWTRRLSARTAVSATARDVAGAALGGPCRIIPGCTDLTRFSVALPRPAEMPAQRRSILFVGRGERRKGLDDLIEAYGRLRADHDDLRLVIVGPPGPLGPGLRARVRAAGWDDVDFVGPVSEADLPAYYQAAHVFAAPASGGEAFGLVLTEAMAAGAAVVAGDNPGYRAVVRDGVDGVLVPPRDPATLANALGGLLRNDATRRRFAEAGRRRAAEFSLESVGEQFLGLYDSLAPAGSSTRRGDGGARPTARREESSVPRPASPPVPGVVS